jgi:hypothetical protein
MGASGPGHVGVAHRVHARGRIDASGAPGVGGRVGASGRVRARVGAGRGTRVGVDAGCGVLALGLAAWGTGHGAQGTLAHWHIGALARGWGHVGVLACLGACCGRWVSEVKESE